ncbi:MAG: hypothetical protein AB1428_10710, partial [Bacteroidota bacterium]
MKKTVLLISGFFTILLLSSSTARAQATHLVVTSVNGGVNPQAGAPFNVVVVAKNALEQPDTVITNTTVTLTLNTGTGTLGGTLTAIINSGDSTATVTGVTYTKAESGVILTASATAGDPLLPGNSPSFTVDPGPAAQLTFGVQPSNTVAGATMSPAVTVRIEDANGNLVTTDTRNVSLAIGTNP